MRRIVHLSDLHFGRVGAETVASLESAVRALSPDLLVVSGDLTQRARTYQFREAAEFLGRFSCAQVVVPGNHDLPFFNLAARFKHPFTRYTQYIHPELEPVYEDDEMLVAGISTPQPKHWTRGELTGLSVKRLRALLEGAGKKIKILVSHHPLEIFRPGPARELLAYGPDVLLAGHLHRSSSAVTATVHPPSHRSAVLVQAGTSTSTRLRGESNTFNLLQIESGRVAVTRYTMDGPGKPFVQNDSVPFVLEEAGWNCATACHLS
jgi:3',5'-cyclic AMP phosphodiesterase CpdA